MHDIDIDYVRGDDIALLHPRTLRGQFFLSDNVSSPLQRVRESRSFRCHHKTQLRAFSGKEVKISQTCFCVIYKASKITNSENPPCDIQRQE